MASPFSAASSPTSRRGDRRETSFSSAFEASPRPALNFALSASALYAASSLRARSLLPLTASSAGEGEAESSALSARGEGDGREEHGGRRGRRGRSRPPDESEDARRGGAERGREAPDPPPSLPTEAPAALAQAPLHSVDRAFLRVPLECALRTLKANSRSLYRDMGVVLAYVLKGKMAKQLTTESPTLEDKMKKLDLLIEKLRKIRDKAQRGSEESRAFLLRCQMRVRRLAEEPDIQQVHAKPDFSFSHYGDRVAWVIHEYLARSGMTDTAALLKQKLGLELFADAEVHEEVLDVLSGLLRQSTAEALAWVNEHRAKLKKLGSLFESELHVQHVLELLKKKDAKTAVAYLKANVGPDDLSRCADIRKVVTLTALLEDPPPQYAALFGIERWHRLACLFLHTSAQVYGFSVKPTLVALLQAGFSALKSSVCEEQKSASCPACLPEWTDYVQKVLTPHRVQSFLICPISGEVMDADNPPLASPDGHVYSTTAIRALAAAAPDGKTVICPKTKQAYPLERFSRIYVT
ncbi:hypothetical protein BESB_048670 [Besnoitia besnoiti]|uniref:Macrophage erythroblast attacher n=1 Tax=Besnoitia besnoiti TaxID=94643 RepID=A0A2A9MFC0_BESBE|nr:hypothetical protein BESB_048670 [Besnoitia besnoiti]PFH36675.1 hypothetical protein BESB_048670 [Besnoitia besnoiti]